MTRAGGARGTKRRGSVTSSKKASAIEAIRVHIHTAKVEILTPPLRVARRTRKVPDHPKDEAVGEAAVKAVTGISPRTRRGGNPFPVSSTPKVGVDVAMSARSAIRSPRHLR